MGTFIVIIWFIQKVPPISNLLILGALTIIISEDPESPPATKYNPSLLSPWEVKGKNKSRRDDIVRLAEALLEAGGYDDKFLSDSSEFEKKHNPQASR